MSETEAKRSGPQLLLGLVFGVVFGFLLQKGGVAHYDVLIGALLLEDFTVFQVMLSAILVGMVGVFAMHGLGLVKLHPKALEVGPNIVGGLVFGVGFGLSGYCPGTGAAAIGQGNLDAVFAALGLLAGSFLYAEMSRPIERTLGKWGERGQWMLTDWVPAPKPVVVGTAAVVLGAVLLLLDRL